MARERRLRPALHRGDTAPIGISGIAVIGLAAILVVSGLGVIAPPPDYGIVPKWSTTTIGVTGDIQLTLRYISDFHVFGAVDGLPVLLLMELESLAKSSESFLVLGMSIKGVSPKGGSSELLEVSINPAGLIVDPGMSVEWEFMLIPHFPKNPPLQIQLSIECSAQGTDFSIRTNAIFRTSGSEVSMPTRLTHVFDPDHVPWLAEISWGAVLYYYSIEASYPVGGGISEYSADLVLLFTAECILESDSINVIHDGSAVLLEISGTSAMGSIVMNEGGYLSPGYTEIFHLGIEFSPQMSEQDIEWTFSVMSS